MMHGGSMGMGDPMGIGLHASGIASMGVPSVQQPIGLNGLLDLLQGAGPGGMIQVHCSLLYNTIITLVRTVSDHNTVIGNLSKNFEELKESVALPDGTTLKSMNTRINDFIPKVDNTLTHVESAIPRLEADIKNVSRDVDVVSRNSVPLNDPSMQQVVNSISSRLQSLEVRQDELNKEKNRIENLENTVKMISSAVTHEAGALHSVTQETSALKNLVSQLRPSTPTQQQQPSQALSPPLKSSIQDMLNTCQSLAGKQSDTVNVVTQSCGRIDQLELAISRIGEAPAAIAPITKAVQDLYTLLDLSLDLSPFLETSDRMFFFLNSFQF